MKIRKTMAVLMVAVMLLGMGQAVQAGTARGGVVGFFAGCCFGIRCGGDYNEGKDIHWREWGRLIPFVGTVLAIWDGIDGAQGVTTADYAEQYGSIYF
ncbi:MAG: hypothetical protein PHP44_13380 [Kiritimatiellae bacterium]|nr:hypothetical protein [Kiritimatiellia bacterium]MDD4737083.1 hypothetical protein [Kiritimatiellia bacterium]